MTADPVDPRAAAVAYPLTIYYDSACPLCATEMRMLVALDVEGRLALSDCAAGRLDDACRAAGLSSADLLAAIHARDADGRWLRGVDVFVAAYRAAGLTRLAAWFADRRLRPVWDRLYPWVARHRDRLSRFGLQHLFRLVPHRRLAARASRATAGRDACARGLCASKAGSGDAGR